MNRLEEIQERLSKATPGPWKFDRENEEYTNDCGGFIGANKERVMDFGDSEQYYPSCGDEPNANDMALIENYHSDIEYLLNEVERLNREVSDLTDACRQWREHAEGKRRY